MNSLKFSFLLMISIFFTSCSKDDIELLEDGIWKLQDAKWDDRSIIKDCDKDDTINFSSSKVFFNVGVVKCSENEANRENTYTLLSDQKILVIGNTRVNVTLLTETKLTLLSTSLLGDFSSEYSK